MRGRGTHIIDENVDFAELLDGCFHGRFYGLVALDVNGLDENFG